MAETRVTYLIGAGASANALPVVNSMNDRMEIFINQLSLTKYSNNKLYRFDLNSITHLKEILIDIKGHYTIDTLAKKYSLTENFSKLNSLKNFLTAYFYFEQLAQKSREQLSYIIENWGNSKGISHKYNIEDRKGYQKSEEYKKIYKHIFDDFDYRYDSFFANYLEKENNKLVVPPNVNIISWNYDSQFELAYSNYLNKHEYKFSSVQELLQVYPNQKNTEIDKNLSSIIKLNGSATFINDKIESEVDLVKGNFTKIITELKKINNIRDENITNLNFAWENEEQVTKAREYAREIISNSDVIVIIGYSFPTFNRDVDRYIFYDFNINYNSAITSRKQRKIYIQDKIENAPKIIERLRAIGDNLYGISETYPEVDQFLIPYEL
ncbi:MAG: hypothetical protein U0T77_03690 [Chitinophagales bacterium]